jgi:hypothetical protein
MFADVKVSVAQLNALGLCIDQEILIYFLFENLLDCILPRQVIGRN